MGRVCWTRLCTTPWGQSPEASRYRLLRNLASHFRRVPGCASPGTVSPMADAPTEHLEGGTEAWLLRPSWPVSYTHLRAHETDSYLVCRLLLEKKKNKQTE